MNASTRMVLDWLVVNSSLPWSSLGLKSWSSIPDSWGMDLANSYSPLDDVTLSIWTRASNVENLDEQTDSEIPVDNHLVMVYR